MWAAMSVRRASINQNISLLHLTRISPTHTSAGPSTRREVPATLILSGNTAETLGSSLQALLAYLVLGRLLNAQIVLPNFPAYTFARTVERPGERLVRFDSLFNVSRLSEWHGPLVGAGSRYPGPHQHHGSNVSTRCSPGDASVHLYRMQGAPMQGWLNESHFHNGTRDGLPHEMHEPLP